MRQMIETFDREAPAGEVVVLEEASHYLFRDREAEVVERMRAFYASITR